MSHAAHDSHEGAETTKQSTPDVKKSDVVKILCILFVLVVILLATKIRSNTKANSKPRNQTEIPAAQSRQSSTPSLPAYYTEKHLLKKGDEPVTVNVPSGYSFTCSGGGKAYYFQAQNSQKEIWGDGKPHTAGNSVGYFSLSCYQDEVNVICEFKKAN